MRQKSQYHYHISVEQLVIAVSSSSVQYLSRGARLLSVGNFITVFLHNPSRKCESTNVIAPASRKLTVCVTEKRRHKSRLRRRLLLRELFLFVRRGYRAGFS